MSRIPLFRNRGSVLRLLSVGIAQLLVHSGVLVAQSNGVLLLDHLDNPHGVSPQKTSYSSCWGYVAPDGKEFGFISTYTGMSVIDVNADTMKEVAFIPGPSSAFCYREIRTHGHVGYIVYDYPTAGEFTGMQIVDLSGLPDTVIPVKTFLYTDSAFGNVSTSHTLSYSDGFLYCNGSSHYAAGGTVMFSVKNDPLNPLFAGQYEPSYLHDTYIRNDTLYGAAIYSGGGLYIADVKNKLLPQTLDKIVYAGSGTHNSWVSVDGKFACTADEIGTTNHDLKVWALDSLPGSAMVAEWTADPTTSIHNVYGRGQYLYVAHYKSGFRVVDIHDPANPVEVGYYDTYDPPVDSVLGPYAGCWATFPYFPSGKIIASDMQSGMYLFRFDGLKPRNRVHLLEPAESTSVTANVQFRWTSAAKQEDDPHDYLLHLEGTNGSTMDTTFSSRDTSYANFSALPAGDYQWFVEVRDEVTRVMSLDTFHLHAFGPQDVDDVSRFPRHYALEQNFPNPFNPRTLIPYQIPEEVKNRAVHVRLNVYNLLGQVVATLVDDAEGPGFKSVSWDATGMPSGVYFYWLSAGSFTAVKKMVLMK